MDETMMEQTGNTQEKVQGLNIVMNGITINGPMFDIHDNHHVVINAASPTPSKEEGHTQEDVAKRDTPEQVASLDDVIKAAEGCQSYFWAQSSWAVVYCVCRDHLEMTDNMSEFERMVEGLPFTKKVVECPEGTVRKAVMRNEFMNYPLHRWPEGRASKLAEKLVEKLDGEAP
jgi:hypothetical protein